MFKPDKKRFCWIKADPTFNGLKQLLYEPISGERVFIGEIKPDQKFGHQVIKKITFDDANFPEEIIFNENLCSIIGSRSSGKSALLAYIADAANSTIARKRKEDGPGEGEMYNWDSVQTKYEIEWMNGADTGNIVYIPQNFLYEKSEDPDEIKRKIEPILFKSINGSEQEYNTLLQTIDQKNEGIVSLVNTWFSNKDKDVIFSADIAKLGSLDSLKKSLGDNNLKIDEFKKKTNLTDEETTKYKLIQEELSNLNSSLTKSSLELILLEKITEENLYFKGLSLSFDPDLGTLPKDLQDSILDKITLPKKEALVNSNNSVLKYKKDLIAKRATEKAKILKIENDHKDLIEKIKENKAVELLIGKSTAYSKTIDKIKELMLQREGLNASCISIETNINKLIEDRMLEISNFEKYIIDNQGGEIENISFGVSCRNDRVLKKLSNKLNFSSKSSFLNLETKKIEINFVRENSSMLLGNLYNDVQKIIVGNTKSEVAIALLTATEEIFFTADMEGDQIGGLKKTTMTPGKRALFALRLILAESDDTWPLLIDQPEDDLDSRSIYNEVVPFLKEKKKERQIIMVSHNANFVIGADSEQIIIANRNGDDRPNTDGREFNYLSGSLENSYLKNNSIKDTLDSQGIGEHSCDILDGGIAAFENRRNKYNI